MHFCWIDASYVQTDFKQALASAAWGASYFDDMIARLPVKSRPGDSLCHFQVSATDHVGWFVNWEHTTGPTAGAILSRVMADPPLIGFDNDDVENLLSSLSDNIDRRKWREWKSLLPCVSEVSNRLLVLR